MVRAELGVTGPEKSPIAMRVFLHGHYNSGNVGDEALLTAIVFALREHLPGRTLELSFVSARLLDLPALPGVRYCTVPDRLTSELRAARNSDLLVFGGGSQFQDLGQIRRVRFFLKPLLLAWLAPRVIGLGLSLGPLQTFAGRLLSRWTLCQMRAVHVRDQESVELARKMGVRAILGDDLALCLQPPERPGRQLSGTVRLLVSMVPLATVLPTVQKASEGIETLHAVLARLKAERPELHLRAADFEPGRDTPQLSRLLDSLESSPPLSGSVTEMFRGFGQADLVLATRLHSMIFAVLMDLPVLAIDYHPKVRAMAAQLGLPESVLVPLDLLGHREELYERLNAFLAAPETFRPARPVATLRARASASVAEVLSRILARAESSVVSTAPLNNGQAVSGDARRK